jgi:hypothetical protein
MHHRHLGRIALRRERPSGEQERERLGGEKTSLHRAKRTEEPSTARRVRARDLRCGLTGEPSPGAPKEFADMAKRSSNQKGPQRHAEGQHGSKTHAAFLEGRHGRHGGSLESEGAPQDESDFDVYGQPRQGRHRLDEDREQHDEAEKNSENGKVGG